MRCISFILFCLCFAGTDSFGQNDSLRKKKVHFTPRDLTPEEKYQDSVATYRVSHPEKKVSAWDGDVDALEKNKKGFVITARGKFATFFIIEDTYFLTYTLGAALSYNRHSLGVDGTFFRWRNQTDDSKDVEMYDQFELRTYVHADYKFTFLSFDRWDLYFNAYEKSGKYKSWYHAYDYPFGGKDMSFLESKTEGTFNEPGAGLGFKYYIKGWPFGIDCNANAAYRSSDNNERNYISSTERDFRDHVKKEEWVFTMRINLFYDFRQ